MQDNSKMSPIGSSSRNNIRQVGSAASSASHQNQILSALDTLGAKLVRSETERETMRKLLNDALDAQERLENQLERSQLDLAQRLQRMEAKGSALSEEEKRAILEQKKTLFQSKKILDDHEDRQIKLEDKLRDSQQTIAKLQRRLDTQEQKRSRLQRRIERVENIASEAQNALEAKAIVLLTDQSDALSRLPHISATQPLEAIDSLHSRYEGRTFDGDGRRGRTGGVSSNALLAAIFVLGLGMVGMSFWQRPMQTILYMDGEGKLAQVQSVRDIPTPAPDEISRNEQQPAINTVPDISDIESETDYFITQDITRYFLDQAITETDVEKISAYDTQRVLSDAKLTIDRDLTLPKSIGPLEEKAFDGVAEAQHDLAALYVAGQQGVKQNYERAAFWFQRSAEQGIGNAAYNLGVLYQQGLGQPQDIQRALDWYRRASQLGHPEAQYNLGIAYIEGVGTRYNPGLAAAFFQEAAFKGIPEAAYNLGLILENGLLGEVRNEDALRWYRAAGDNGSAEGALAFTELAGRLGVPTEGAGLLENGRPLSAYIRSADADVGTDAVFEDASTDISLGTLIPSKEQILVAQIQEQLRKGGLYNGPQDGVVGSGTVRAIKTYQRNQSLPIDGMATEDLLTYMLQTS